MKIEMYHATDLANFDSIFEKGLLKGIDKCVYCCDTQKRCGEICARSWRQEHTRRSIRS